MFGSRRCLIILTFFALTMLVFPSVSNANEEGLVSEISVPVGQSLQEAINSAVEGDTILIQNGVHVEGKYPVFVNKSVTLMGQDVEQTIVDGNSSMTGIFIVSVDDVRIINLTVQNTTSNYGISGIHVAHVRNVEISGCTVAYCGSGIQLTDSTDGNITKNRIADNLGNGIYLHSSSSYNRIFGNNITDNPIGVLISDMFSQLNLFHYNNFVNNTSQLSAIGALNYWNATYPAGGNYWDDHANLDLMNGVDQNVVGSDGIADSSYQDLDWYPLTKPIYFYSMGQWSGQDYCATIASNSTISGFRFDPSAGSFVSFDVAGEDFTVGCCRVAVPKNVLWVDSLQQWAVMANGTALVPNSLIVEDAENTYFYFSYDHSIQSIRIVGTHVVPELLLLAILALLTLFVGLFVLLGKLEVSSVAAG
jgi:parallel beta-helix repeat protein